MTLPRRLLDLWPRLAGRLDFAELGAWPTPVEPLGELGRALGRPLAELHVKRDDRSSPIYGGNKVRTLEVLFGAALAQGKSNVVATGAYGSNHALATVLHARRVGLSPGVALFPQPPSPAALAGLRATLAHAARVTDLRHWSALPFGVAALRFAAYRRKVPTLVMVPGGATALGALGYVAAAFELAEQVQSGALPAPRSVYVGVGSNATSAGLLLGFTLAARAGLGFSRSPGVVAVRVSPWPVTSRTRILGLASAASRLLSELTGDPSVRVAVSELAPQLRIDGRYLGAGYGYATPAGLAAIERFRELGLFELDTTYSAKVVAALSEAVRNDEPGPTLFWSTRSTVQPPAVPDAALAGAPRGMKRWLARAERLLGSG